MAINVNASTVLMMRNGWAPKVSRVETKNLTSSHRRPVHQVFLPRD